VSPTAPPLPVPAAAPGPHATPASGVASLEPVTSLVDRLDALLPQTQCTRCGYPDCRAYAQALAEGEAAPDRCPPGGEEGVRRLAALLDRPAGPLAPDVGAEAPRQLVFIDEARCIGCTLCIQACPVDAILGAPKRMHAVVEPLCTGCELCLPACPVDCILLENASGDATGWDAWTPAQAGEARARYLARTARLERAARAKAARLAQAARKEARAPLEAPPPATAETPAAAPAPAAVDPKRAAIEAALARARARLGS